MTLGLVGKKIGMTRVFAEDGRSIPVTVIEVEPNRISLVRSPSRDGYSGVQVTTGHRRASRVNSAMRGHFAKAGVAPGRGVWEFRADESALGEAAPGGDLTVAMFEAGQKVDVRGVTMGKGFAGVVKRYGFRGGRATHGNSLSHRAPGSIGQRQDPGRVFPGKKMAGHMGARRRSQQNLEIVRVDADRNLLLVRGAVPGPRGGDVIVRPAARGSGSS